MRNKLAVIFDFDDTLTNDSTSALLRKYDFSQEDVDRFWKKDVARLVREDGWEETNAWLHLLLGYMKAEDRMPWMTNEELRAFGKTLVPFEGLNDFLDDLRAIAEKAWCEVQFYIISGGIQDIIEGFSLRPKFTAVWGCRLAPGPNGKVCYVKRAITFTEKTRYLFVINKGLDPLDVDKKPSLVNRYRSPKDRPVPFENMFYIGDGISDIPCFSVINRLGGAQIELDEGPEESRRQTFAVFPPGNADSARRVMLELVYGKRVASANAAEFGKSDDFALLFSSAFTARCLQIKGVIQSAH